jgi:hypothetical protein
MMNLRHGSKLRANREPGKDRRDTYDLAGEPKRFDDALPVKFQENHRVKAIECDSGIRERHLSSLPHLGRCESSSGGSVWIKLFPTNEGVWQKPEQLLNQFQRINQGILFPALQEQSGPLSDRHRQLAAVLSRIEIESPVAIGQAARLSVDAFLQRLYGWESQREIPHESQCSRGFTEVDRFSTRQNCCD